MNYGHHRQLTLNIYTVYDDKDKFHTTVLDVYSTYEINPYQDRYYRRRQEIENNELNVSLKRSRVKGDPLILSLKNELQKYLGWGSRGYNNAPKEFKVAFVLAGSGAAFLIEKKTPYYHLMGIRMTKKNVMIALSRALYRSCFEDDGLVLMDYLFKMINLPENITYVLENRTPYWWVNLPDRERVEVRLNTKMISSDECAIEISDGVWAPISVKDLDIFVNYFYHGHSRARKWAYISPAKLWRKLIGSVPTESQKTLMMEFLAQNRTQDLIESRAKQLMHELTVKYEGRIKMFDYGNNRIMLVRGKLCDWVIIDSTYKTNVQKVKTYVFIHSDLFRKGDYSSLKNEFLNGQLRGPICIDNIHDNSSVGDQYAARALALLNDDITVKLIYTIGRYLPDSLKEGNAESRFENFDSLHESEGWGIIT